MTALTAADFDESGAEESYSEGVIDHLRAVEGTAVAALVRDRIGDSDGEGRRCARSRCVPPTIASTCRRSPARRAAAATARPPGFTTALELARAGRVPAARRSPQLAGRRDGASPTVATACSSYDKPAGITSHDVVARVRRRGPAAIKVGHAGTLDPFATGLLLVLVGRATRVQRFLMALPKTYEATARFGAVSTTGDPEGEIVETGARPRRRARAARPARSASARRRTRRSRSAAGAPTRWPAPARRSSSPSARSTSTGSRSAGATATGAAS